MKKNTLIWLMLILACSCNKKDSTDAVHFRLPYKIYVRDSITGNYAITIGGKYRPDSVKYYELSKNGTIGSANFPCQDAQQRIYFCGNCVNAYGSNSADLFVLQFETLLLLYFGNNDIDTLRIIKNTKDSVRFLIGEKVIGQRYFPDAESSGTPTEITYIR